MMCANPDDTLSSGMGMVGVRKAQFLPISEPEAKEGRVGFLLAGRVW
jgi:hypothetical protein